MKDLTSLQNGKLIIALSRALQHVHKESERLFHQNNLTMAQFMVLEALYHKGELTVSDITRAVLSTSGNITVVLRNLEHRALILRQENPGDKRSFIIALTPQGKNLIQPVFAQHMALVGQALTPLTDTEKNQVITILKKLSKKEAI